MSKEDPFRAFWQRTLAERVVEVPAIGTPAASPASNTFQMLVGSVGRDSYILGDVPKDALKIILCSRDGNATGV